MSHERSISAPEDLLPIPAAPELAFGPDEIKRKLESLVTQTKREVATFSPDGAYTAAAIRDSQDRNKEMYTRGIHSRTIYLSSARNKKPIIEYVSWLNERGSEVRTVPKLPLRMIISDRKIAVLPLDPHHGMAGISIHRDEAVVSSLQTLFEMTWASATPFGLTIASGEKGPTIEERAILELLSLGRSDMEIATQLGLSARTIRRRLVELMERLQAKTRFEAAYLAVKKNWI